MGTYSVLAHLEDALGGRHVESEADADRAIARLGELPLDEVAALAPRLLRVAENWTAIAGLDGRCHAIYRLLDRAEPEAVLRGLATEFCDASGAPDPAQQGRLTRLALDDAGTTRWANALLLRLWPETAAADD
jgi:hypothetical protein